MSRIEFGGSSEYLNREIHIGFYTCPHCNSSLKFDTSDFERHYGKKESNLEQGVQEAFDAFRPLEQDHWESFVDFYCSGCSEPVRIIYGPGEGYAMGAYTHRLVAIVEMKHSTK